MSLAMQARADGLVDTEAADADVFSLIDRIAEQAIADAQLVGMARERAQRLEQRAERHRGLLLRMLEALDTPKLERGLFTATISHHRKPVVTDAAAVPPDYQRQTPDMQAIAKALNAGKAVAGAELSNDQPRLTLRTR